MSTMCVNCAHCREIGAGDDRLKAAYKGSGLYRCEFETRAGHFVTGLYQRECERFEQRERGDE